MTLTYFYGDMFLNMFVRLTLFNIKPINNPMGFPYRTTDNTVVENGKKKEKLLSTDF